jgi:Siderophore-interacting protein
VYAWVAGEAVMLRPIRRWFKQTKQVAAGYTDVAGYWRDGLSQHEAARSCTSSQAQAQANRITAFTDSGPASNAFR